MIIDFHTHAFPDKIAQRAIDSLYKKGGIPPRTDGSVSDLIAKMDLDGIDISVVHSIATKPEQERNVNDFAISLLDNPRIIPFGSVFPGSDTCIYEIERLHDAGVKGIKFHPEYQWFDIDSREMFPIYEKCAELSMIIEFHTGGDVAYEPPYHSTGEKMEWIAANFPETTMVFAHMGGYDRWQDFADNVKPHKNLYIDTSMTGTVAILSAETARRIIEIHGVDKFLFGSDMPWERQCNSLKKLYSFGLSDEDNKKILCENAKKLLKI